MMNSERVIWWVRHGPTHARSMVGWSDLPADLSDRAALGRLDAFLPRAAPIFSSDLARTVATADALAAGRSRLPHQAGLREMNFGAWEQRAFADIEAEDPDRIRAFWSEPGDVAPPGGESWNALSQRVETTLNALEAPKGDVIIVAHFGVILSQVQRALGVEATEAFSQPIDPLSVTRIRYGASRTVELINHIP